MRFEQQIVTGNYYVTVMDLSNGKIFDFTGNTWAVFGAGTTPYVVMTGVSIGTKKIYYADVDLNLLFADSAPHEVAVTMYTRAGGAPDPTTDTPQATFWPLRVACGHVMAANPYDSQFVVDVTADLTSNLGTSMHMTVELMLNGVTVPLHTLDPTATCAIAVTQDATASAGARIAQFSMTTVDVGAANASSRFEAEYANPGLASMRGFTAVATIVTGGVTYVGSCKFVTF